jgi:O-antigen/teichoic acid export membrane protein
MTGYTVKTFFTLLLGAFSGTVDRMLLGKLVPATQVAYYNIASNVGLRVQGLGAAILGPVFHQSNRAVLDSGHEGVRRIHSEAFSLIFGWCLLAIAIASLWRVPLLRLWLGEELGQLVAPLFLPIVLACSIQVMSSISAAQLSSLNRQGALVVFQLLRVLLAVVGGLVGWKLGGLAGFAWGVQLSRTADLGQDILLLTIVGPVAWATSSAGRALTIQLMIAAMFLILRTSSTDWRIGACLGIIHFACGSIPMLYTWIGPQRFKTLVWSCPK